HIGRKGDLGEIAIAQAMDVAFHDCDLFCSCHRTLQMLGVSVWHSSSHRARSVPSSSSRPRGGNRRVTSHSPDHSEYTGYVAMHQVSHPSPASLPRILRHDGRV